MQYKIECKKFNVYFVPRVRVQLMVVCFLFLLIKGGSLGRIVMKFARYYIQNDVVTSISSPYYYSVLIVAEICINELLKF